MIRYQCDKCGTVMHANDPQRFIVRVEIYAAAGHVDLDEEAQRRPTENLQSVLGELAAANPDEIEDQTYRLLRFDLCNTCRRALLERPLGR